MIRSKFLKNKDLTAGMKFCIKCGDRFETNCIRCETEALRDIGARRTLERPGPYDGFEYSYSDSGISFTLPPDRGQSIVITDRWAGATATTSGAFIQYYNYNTISNAQASRRTTISG
jgi:hypothetical protein